MEPLAMKRLALTGRERAHANHDGLFGAGILDRPVDFIAGRHFAAGRIDRYDDGANGAVVDRLFQFQLNVFHHGIADVTRDGPGD